MDEIEAPDPTKYPSFRYRLKDGVIEKRQFYHEPEGWYDSPAGLALLVAPIKTVTKAELAERFPEPPKKRGRPKGSKNKT